MCSPFIQAKSYGICEWSFFQMSGFPFSTNEAKWRLQSLSRLGIGWSIARFLWGCVALTTVMEGWLDQFQTSKLSYTILLVSSILILLCMICR